MDLVSINIPTYNSANTLMKCLESIKNQQYQYIEVLVIDSYSQDDTLKISRDFGVKTFFAKSLAEARNIGVKESKGRYIFLVDSDQILEPNTVSECVRTCEEELFDAVTLFERSIITKNTIVEKLIAYDKWLFHSLHDDHPIYGSAIPRFFKARLLKRIDFERNPPITFEHSIIHSEIIKMGARIKFLDVYISHYETLTFKDVFRKFKRYGYYYLPALKKDSKLVIHHSLPRRAYFTSRAFKKPFLLAGLFGLYFLKGFATFAGLISYLITSKSNR